MPSSIHHFTLGDEDLGILDEKKFMNSDAILVKNASGQLAQPGLTVQQFFSALNDADPIALQTLVWFLRFKQGKQQHISTIDFAIADLQSEDIEPDPMSAPTGTTEPETSGPSPITSDTPPTSTTV